MRSSTLCAIVDVLIAISGLGDRSGGRMLVLLMLSGVVVFVFLLEVS